MYMPHHSTPRPSCEHHSIGFLPISAVLLLSYVLPQVWWFEDVRAGAPLQVVQVVSCPPMSWSQQDIVQTLYKIFLNAEGPHSHIASINVIHTIIKIQYGWIIWAQADFKDFYVSHEQEKNTSATAPSVTIPTTATRFGGDSL